MACLGKIGGHHHHGDAPRQTQSPSGGFHRLRLLTNPSPNGSVNVRVEHLGIRSSIGRGARPRSGRSFLCPADLRGGRWLRSVNILNVKQTLARM